jgi:hypothetical protein
MSSTPLECDSNGRRDSAGNVARRLRHPPRPPPPRGPRCTDHGRPQLAGTPREGTQTKTRPVSPSATRLVCASQWVHWVPEANEGQCHTGAPHPGRPRCTGAGPTTAPRGPGRGDPNKTRRSAGRHAPSLCVIAGPRGCQRRTRWLSASRPSLREASERQGALRFSTKPAQRAASSRVTSRGSLSSRRPLKEACRTSPAAPFRRRR